MTDTNFFSFVADYDKVISQHSRSFLWSQWQFYSGPQAFFRYVIFKRLTKAAGPLDINLPRAAVPAPGSQQSLVKVHTPPIVTKSWALPHGPYLILIMLYRCIENTYYFLVLLPHLYMLCIPRTCSSRFGAQCHLDLGSHSIIGPVLRLYPIFDSASIPICQYTDTFMTNHAYMRTYIKTTLPC